MVNEKDKRKILINYYIGVGSNMGNRLKYLEAAMEAISEYGRIIKKSAVYEAKAWGETDQPDFLNCVINFKSGLNPELLLEKLQQIEMMAGRQRNKDEKWKSRTLDLDILFADDKVIDSEKLKLPHPFLQERNFVLVPLSEIAPYFIHPILNKSVNSLLLDCKDELPVKIFSK